MGKPIKILDLAEDMIRLSGFKLNDEIQIIFSGVKKGEKIVEELCAENEIVGTTSHPRIHLGRITQLTESVPELVTQLHLLLQAREERALRNFLSQKIRWSCL